MAHQLKLNTSAVEELKSKISFYNRIQDTKTLSLTKDTSTIKPDDGYCGISSITAKGETNLKPETIGKGKTILGITGTYSNRAPNGTEWTQSNIIDRDIGHLHYANGIWVAGGDYNEGGLYYSTDGKTWILSNLTDDIGFYSLHHANGVWVAGSNEGLYYSTDGKTWISVDTITLESVSTTYQIPS